MQELTSSDRVAHILRREPVDRVGIFEHFWSDTRRAWIERGDIEPDTDLNDHFGFDMVLQGAINLTAQLDFTPVVVEEDEETRLVRDANGSSLDDESGAVDNRESFEKLAEKMRGTDYWRVSLGGAIGATEVRVTPNADDDYEEEFNISDDPITFDRTERSYRTRFKVSFPLSDRL